MATLNKTPLKKTLGFRIGSLIVAALIVSIGIFVAPPTGLELAGWRMLMIVLGVVVLFFTEAVPVCATCFIIVALMKYLNVVPWKTIQQTAANQTVFFIMASFGIGAAMKKTNIAPILLRFLFRKFVKGSGKRLIAVVTILTAIISTIVNNGVAQVVIIAMVLSMFSAMGDPEPGTSNLCKGVILGVCVGSQTGGLAMPCSNAVNAVLMDLSESIGGQPMTFLQWSIFGIPTAIIVTAFACWLIPFMVKPEPISPEQMAGMEKSFEKIPHRLERNDILFLVAIIGMVIAWISGTWIKKLDIATVAMIGVVFMMLPGIGILTPKEYFKNFSPSNIVVLLCLFPMASAMASSGAGEWVINNIFAGAGSWSGIIFYIMAAVAAFVVHLLIPAASANASLSALVMGPVAVACGIPSAAILFIIGCQAGSSYILPVDGIWAYTLGYGYYEFSDPMRKLWPLVLFITLFAVTIVPLLTLIYSGAGLIA